MSTPHRGRSEVILGGQFKYHAVSIRKIYTTNWVIQWRDDPVRAVWRKWMRIWNGSIKSSARTPISRKPCDDWRFRKRGAPGKTRPQCIPSVYDRVCQQELVNRLEPIFGKVFDLIRAALGIAKVARPPMPCPRFGTKRRPETVDRRCGSQRLFRSRRSRKAPDPSGKANCR
jgi:hypothetical protein